MDTHQHSNKLYVYPKGIEIINRLREVKRPAGSIAKTMGFGRAYLYNIIYGRNPSWAPKAMRIRNAIAQALKTTPDTLWKREANLNTKNYNP
jgi:hypothetical protein